MNNDNSILNINGLLKFVYKYRLALIISLIFSVLISSIISIFFMEERYKSSVIIFPTTTNSISQALLIEDNPYKKDILEFGEEESTEQLLQVLNSDMIKDSIINMFDLYLHYEINKEDIYAQTWMNLEYQENISFKKTPYNSIKIEVIDKDPNIASDIANKFLDLIDVAMNHIRSQRANRALFISQERKRELQNSLSQVNDSLNVLRGKGVIYGEVQVERLTEQYAIALSQNNKRGADILNKELQKISKHVTAHNLLVRKTSEIQDELNRIQNVCDLIKIDTKYDLMSKFVINKAYPADKKSYPIRWLIVFSSTFSTLVTTILFLRLFEIFNIKKNAY